MATIWLAALALPLYAAHESHDRSVAELQQAQASEEVAIATRDAQVARLVELNDRLDELTRTLDLLERGSARTRSEADAAEARLAELAPAVALASDQLSQTSTLAEQQVLASINLHNCSQGTTDALSVLVSGDRKGSLDRLRGVIDACRFAQLAMTDGGDIEFPWDFPDPSVLEAEGTYYAFATNSLGGNVQVIQSTIYGGWTWVGEALPDLPAWAKPGTTWAPSAVRVGDRYALYFSALTGDSAMKCIGVAFSPEPKGPYTGASPEPLVCQPEEAGSIDPSPFTNTDGVPYLVWKSEGDANRGVAKLWSAPLSADGGQLTWFPTELLAADRGDESSTIEGPNMVRVDDRWILLYSANDWKTADYRTDYAVCDSASGPCRKPPDNTVLSSNDTTKGPGGGEVFRAQDGSLRIAYHGWLDPDVGFPNSRYLHIDRFRLDEAGRPVIEP